MNDLQTSKRSRGFTRTKIKKLLNRAQLSIDDELRDEIPAMIRSLETTAQTLAAQNTEVLDLLDDKDAEEDIDAALQYELDVGNMIDALNKLLTTSISEEKKESKNNELFEILKQQNEMSNALIRNQELSMLPKREMEIFDGKDITKFKPFINSFRRLIEEKTDSCSDRLYYLEQYTTGLPHELVRSCCHMDPSRGYRTAMKCLQEKYGNEFDIANAFLDKIEAWPIIKPEDGPALEKFSVFLASCVNYTEDIGALHQLNSTKEMQLILQKLPYKQREKWRTHVLGLIERDERVSFDELVKFVIRESKLLNLPVFGSLKGTQAKSSLQRNSDVHNQKSSARTAMTMTTGVVKDKNQKATDAFCSCCNRGKHSLDDCSTFQNKAYHEKRNFVLSNGICFGCLRHGHRSKQCVNRLTCNICKRKHPTSFHIDDRGKDKEHEEQISPETETKSCVTGAGTLQRVALALIPVKIRVKNRSQVVTTYAGLDNFSSDCFISNRLLQKLNAAGPETEIMLTTMENKRTPTRTRVISNLEISDMDENERMLLPPTYSTEELPVGEEDITRREDIEDWPDLRDLPFNFINAEVGLILGINVPEAIKCLEIVNSTENGPYASRHRLGWALNGPLSVSRRRDVHMHRIRVEKLEDIESKLQSMYSHDFQDSHLDGLGPSVEDKIWETRVESSITLRNEHYEINLPFRKDQPSFPDNRIQARQCIDGTKRRLQNRPDLHRDYNNFMEGMIKKGYAERIPPDELKIEPGKSWYLVHHAIHHKEKGKLRVVFNCSLRFRGVSLNDELLQGPDFVNDLLGILLRFRQGYVAITGDIEQMFYQVKVPREHTNFLRFLWFPNGDLNAEPVDYRLKVHVFGASSSPSCANYALRKTAADNQTDFAKSTTQTVIRDFYVDDMVKSVDDLDEAISMVHDVRELCLKGGFNLTKFVSNAAEVMESVPQEHWAKGIKEINLDREEIPFQRALGVRWNVQQDSLSFKVSLQEQPLTRRGILSTIFSVYDPFGLVGPAILPAKRIFQQMCRLKCGWDNPMSSDQETSWRKWITDLPLLTTYSIPRCYRPHDFTDSSCEMHIFCDGSEIGYGVAAYLRFQKTSGEVHCDFVMAKSRLAPLKKSTIPRLELTAAKLAVTVKCMLDRELELNIVETVFWTDSTVVLWYINNTTKRFQRFVANRISFIREHTKPEQWRHVPSRENPADYASKGVPIPKFLNLQDWSSGPKFLWNRKSFWPKQNQLPEELNENVEVCKEKKVLSTKNEPEPIDLIVQASSSWTRLRRKIAWLVKIKNRLLSREESPEISVDDLKKAEIILFRHLQKLHFPEELERLSKNLVVYKRSPLRKLNPFLDDHGVILVGGRLRNANIADSEKYPVILPKDHHLSRLIIRSVHERLGHLGRETTLANLRKKFWIINANAAVRRLVKQCVPCRKLEGKAGEQIMADLPKDRLCGDHAPFTNVGVDYYGPFHVVRGRGTEKRYGVVFSCLETRAIHLEVASSLDTSSFINVLRRFISRRGQPHQIRSDNGTNLVGGNNELKKSIQEWNQSQIMRSLQQDNIEWIFQPPSASHFGGVWEREIRTIRKVLQGLLQEQRIRLTDDNLITLMCEVESILNQRPLSTVSDDPQDLDVLTPNHLLLLRPKTTFPPGIFSPKDMYNRRRWRQVQYLADVFWSRWRKEYVSLLQSRQKWTKPLRNFSVGDIVLISETSVLRNQWPMGRIISVKEDDDGRVRVACVKTSESELVRPITKLVLLIPSQV